MFLEKNINSVTHLPSDFNSLHYCIVGASPSLDFCENEIQKFIEEKTIFILTDAIAQNFIQRFSNAKRLVITVESRLHAYLRFLKNEHIFFYWQARQDNLPKFKNYFYPFYLAHEDIQELPSYLQTKSILLVSPGTVGGLALALAFFLSLNQKKLSQAKITLMGMDFSYPDNRIFSRYASIHYLENRFSIRENWSYQTVLQKTSYLENLNGQLLRSSWEFKKSAQNCQTLIDSLPSGTLLEDYSIAGIFSDKIKKKIPFLPQHS